MPTETLLPGAAPFVLMRAALAEIDRREGYEVQMCAALESCRKWAVADKTCAVACEAGRNLIKVLDFSVLASANEYLWHQFIPKGEGYLEPLW